jgi:hypothetical protein
MTEGRKKDGMFCHLADGIQWKRKNFKREIRNLRFGLCTNGVNPFGDIGHLHSTWPVTLCIYNLPFWLCMKRKFIIMSMLISGAAQYGIDINVYLQPLLDELLILWAREGVKVWDEQERGYFNLCAMLFITIQDGLALGSILGQVFKGYNGCMWCVADSGGI